MLRLQQAQAGDVQLAGSFAAPAGPIQCQGGVAGRRGAPDHLVPDDFRPGEPEHVGAAVAVAEYPLVVPGLAELAEVAADDPPGRLIRVAMLGQLVGELPQVVIQRREYLAGYHRPVVGRPAPDDGVEPGDDRLRVSSAQGPQFGAQPFPDPLDCRLARLDQQPAAVLADIEPEEVEALVEGDDARLVLVEGQAPGRQPAGEPCLDLFGLLPGVAEGDQVVGVPDQHRGAGHREGGGAADPLVPDSGSVFHPCSATFSSAGLTTPPWGVPSPVGVNRPSSTTPAVSHPATSSLAGNVPSWPRRWSWPIRSNAAARSASSTHIRRGPAPLRPLPAWKMASIASWQPRPGRKPYDLGSNRASHSGSSALATRACCTRSAITGMPSGRCFPLALGI